MEPKRAMLGAAEDSGAPGPVQRDTPRLQPSVFPEPGAQRLAPDPQGPVGGTGPYYHSELQLPAEAPRQAQSRQLLGGPYHHHHHHHYAPRPFPHFQRRPDPRGYPTPEAGAGVEGRPWPFGRPLEATPPEAFLPLQHRSRQLGKAPSPACYRHYPQAVPGPRDEALRRDKKPKKPGKHICQYCGRACAKPSVLKKHIRSHTGERPYPCAPCGFSFKTKSNLYKHRKSHAHAIKAGLLSAEAEAEPSCRSDTEPLGGGEEAGLHSDADESTDTDEELCPGKRLSQPESPEPEVAEAGNPILQRSLRVSQKYSSDSEVLSEESPAGPMKVPILIVPKCGLQAQAEGPPAYVKTEACPSPPVMVWKYGGPHTIKQRLALRLNEKRGQDSEQSVNLLSPHSKGSTDSGYFSRSESAEQQVSPPNTNAKSYAEIIFGKFARLAPRPMAVNVALQEPPPMACKDKAGLVAIPGDKPDLEKFIEEHILQLISHNNVLVDPSQLDPVKPRRFTCYRGDGGELRKHPMALGEAVSEARAFSEESLGPSAMDCFVPSEKELLGIPPDTADSATLTRSNSMPISSGNGLGVPQVLRGSHSFDERMTGSDDVFHAGSALLPHQRMLKRQTAIELFSGLEGHAPGSCGHDDGEQGPGTFPRGSPAATGATKTEEGELAEGGDPSLLVMKAQKGVGTVYECEICGVKYQIWDNFEAHRKFYCSHGPRAKCGAPKPLGEGGLELSQTTVYKAGPVLENLPFRKRRKEKSVGDEEDIPGRYGGPYGGLTWSPPSGAEPKAEGNPLTDQEPVPRTVSVSTMTTSGFFGLPREPVAVATAEESEPQAMEDSPGGQGLGKQDGGRRGTGNEISVIQHTNSLSWPGSFERSESMELLSGPGGPDPSPEVGMGVGQHPPAEVGELQAGPQPQPTPKLVRQHNIQVPEIRVTEEPDKPEKEPDEAPVKEAEKVPEEFQWPQRSETLSQLPAEKLPPKKKRLRLAELQYSSGESSLESGTLSRSLSQDSNWSHSSSFSLSLERDEGPKPGTSGRPETAEYLTVPYVVNSPGLLGQQQQQEQQQQKEMRRSASEQAPCQPYLEMVETRSKSFDYGNLSGGPGGAGPRCGPAPASSPAVRERRRCFLVRQASLGQYSENSQPEHGLELGEPMQVSGHQACGPALPTRGPRHRPASPTDRPCDAPYPPLDFHQPWQLYQPPPPFPAPGSEPYPPTAQWPAVPLQLPCPSLPPGEAYPGQPVERRPQARPGWGDKEQPCPSPRASPQHSPGRRAHAPTPRSSRTPPSLLVPVRIQANMPIYGSVMYTSVSHASGGTRGPLSHSPGLVICKVEGRSPAQEPGGVGGAQCAPWGLPTPSATATAAGTAGEVSVPLTVGLVSSDGGTSIGGSKRMLSPASSLELSVETQQQKRVKEEKICGQMLEKLSLRESGTPSTPANAKAAKPQLVRQFCTTGEAREGQPSPSGSSPRWHGPQSLESAPSEERLSLGQCSDMESLESLEVESPQRGPPSPGDLPSEPPPLLPPQHKFPISMLLQVPVSQGGTVVGGTVLLSDVSDLQQFLQFPSLRTSTSVSWCFLNYTKPNPTRHMAPKLSMYATWCISSYNPNPPGTATKVALALLRSKQKAAKEIYIMSALNWPSSGKLVASSGWKQRIAQMKWYESSQCDHDAAGRKAAGSFEKERDKMETGVNKDQPGKQVEPTRIKIFDGGYKSNEDYVYVRGRGRGKYICEECGIRCKKPSMLKKHIRTHTDLRPFMCKFCNFAFKTKGNLTKHMKSKAHTKKCLELGIAVTCTYSTDTEEAGIPEEPEKDALGDVPVRHQFSDPEESDGAEEEADEDDDDEDDDDEDRQGDSTPTTRSRSTSPLPRHSRAPSGTFGITSSSAFDVSPSTNQSSLISYLVTLPRIQATQFMPPSYSHVGTPLTDYPRHLQSRLAESAEHKDRLDIPTPPNVWLARTSDDTSSREDSSREVSPSGDTGSSAHPSPAYEGSPGSDPSPTPRRYLSPRRELSPRRHLSPRREISPIRHRSPKRDTYLSEFCLRRDASPRRPFLQRREIQSPRQLSPVKDLSPRRELSPRRDYRDRRHMPLVRATSPRRGCLQGGTIVGPYVQHSDLSLRPSHQNPLDSSRMVPWPSYPVCETAQGDQSHAILPNGPQGCLFSHLPLHSQQQVRAPYQMIPIGGIQMVHSGDVPLPGPLPAPQLPLGARRREESVIDEATHCVIESIKEMDIFSKSEDVQIESPMAVSPPRPTSPTDPLGAEVLGGTGEEGVRGRMAEQRTLQGPLAPSRGHSEHPVPPGQEGEEFRSPAEEGERAGRAGCPPGSWAWGISASPP
ncbi:transcription factor HIVEP2a [Chiloscyllium plagiosum]|uniref:transcription factor HIVEP2a n=1 Tax=Chiloscyllium plagiosum TaxID=36176 RepID=UPI001CB7BB72|nr:transcription factor HIVEP2a [Chiloscyllium plagiosum]XP_043551263.1 transcription factor HIVEP2a [Chiloscyllium plagiosum]XP_043551264.1 transcription factor HIVEP2a [Chiloscyllium plagiosum]XP_043551265.1 transcription factor HIVEP2a [Chiloscyllium plagiosum]XP_043551266.1 transcription factor HIVEP2a [Chiloscyllium plagiosum]